MINKISQLFRIKFRNMQVIFISLSKTLSLITVNTILYYSYCSVVF